MRPPNHKHAQTLFLLFADPPDPLPSWGWGIPPLCPFYSPTSERVACAGAAQHQAPPVGVGLAGVGEGDDELSALVEGSFQLVDTSRVVRTTNIRGRGRFFMQVLPTPAPPLPSPPPRRNLTYIPFHTFL